MKIRDNLRNLALLAGAALLSTGAIAAPWDSSIITKKETVKYSKVDAHTPDGAAALYRKLSDAAASVCTLSGVDAMSYYDANSYEGCFTKALDKAVHKVNIADVTALYFENKASGRLASAAQPSTAEPEVVASR